MVGQIRLTHKEAVEKLKELINDADTDTIALLLEKNFAAVKECEYDIDSDCYLLALEDGMKAKDFS